MEWNEETSQVSQSQRVSAAVSTGIARQKQNTSYFLFPHKSTVYLSISSTRQPHQEDNRIFVKLDTSSTRSTRTACHQRMRSGLIVSSNRAVKKSNAYSGELLCARLELGLQLHAAFLGAAARRLRVRQRGCPLRQLGLDARQRLGCAHQLRHALLARLQHR